jgi:hypothetical protein
VIEQNKERQKKEGTERDKMREMARKAKLKEREESYTAALASSSLSSAAIPEQTASRPASSADDLIVSSATFPQAHHFPSSRHSGFSPEIDDLDPVSSDMGNPQSRYGIDDQWVVDDSDGESIASLDSYTTRASTETSASSLPPSKMKSEQDDDLEGVERILVSPFLADAALLPLYVAALRALGPDRFNRNIARLLVHYSSDLRHEASGWLQTNTALVVCCRWLSSNTFCDQLGTFLLRFSRLPVTNLLGRRCAAMQLPSR